MIRSQDLINVVMCEDSKGHGALPIHVCLSSLCDANSGLNFEIYLFTDISPNEFNDLFLYIKDRSNIRLNILPLVGFLAPNLSNGGFQKYSLWHRLIFPYVLCSLDKYLFLDSDVIVLSSIQDLWNTEVGNNLICGALDNVGIRTLKSRELSLDETYFNAGVLLYNARAWRKDIDILRIFEWIESKLALGLACSDQDAINYCCYGRKFEISRRFNTLNPSPEMLETQQVAIAHFAGPIKPWHSYSIFEHQKLYNSVLRKVTTKVYIQSKQLNFSQRVYISFQLLRMGDTTRSYEWLAQAATLPIAPDWFTNSVSASSDLASLIELLGSKGYRYDCKSPYEIPGIL